MTGHDILNRQIGNSLTEVLFQSYFFEGILSDKINVLFLKFDTWLHVTVSDEKTIIKHFDTLEEIKPTTISETETFNYTLTKIQSAFPDFDKFIGQTLVAFNELVWQDNNDISCGIIFYFDKGDKFVLYDEWLDDDWHMNLSFSAVLPDKTIVSSQM